MPAFYFSFLENVMGNIHIKNGISDFNFEWGNHFDID
jgi:hypothetical protein